MHAARIVALVAVTLSCLLARPAAAAAVVDLTQLEWTVKKGFAPADAAGFPSTTGRPAGPFPILPNQLFDVKPGEPLQRYTLQTTFDLDDRYATDRGLLGLHFAVIGENWQIFINGNLLAEAMSERDGELEYRRTVRDLVVALPPGMLRIGRNRLVVHLIGDSPSTRLTWNTALGYFQRNDYYIDSLTELQREHHDVANILVLAMLCLFMAYAAVLAWFRRSEPHYVRFVFLCGALAVFYFTRSRYVFDLVRDTEHITRVEYTMGFLAGGLFFEFVHAFLQPSRGTPIFPRFYVAVSFGAAMAALLVPFRFTIPLLLVWQAFSIVAACYLVWFVGRAAAAQVPDARSLMPSLFVFSLLVLWDITDSIYFRSGRRYSQYGFTLFTTTLAYVASMRTVRMRNATLQHLGVLREREARLNALFEASFEALVLHVGGKIVDTNPSFSRLFGYDLEAVRGKHVDELFAESVVLTGSNGGVSPGEALARRSDGTTFFVEYTNRPWAWDGVTGEVLTLRDVDVEKRAEGELRERNAELESLVRSMHDRETRLKELETELETLRKRRG